MYGSSILTPQVGSHGGHLHIVLHGPAVVEASIPVATLIWAQCHNSVPTPHSTPHCHRLLWHPCKPHRHTYQCAEALPGLQAPAENCLARAYISPGPTRTETATPPPALPAVPWQVGQVSDCRPHSVTFCRQPCKVTTTARGLPSSGCVVMTSCSWMTCDRGAALEPPHELVSAGGPLACLNLSWPLLVLGHTGPEKRLLAPACLLVASPLNKDQ